jgi:hypothetical protein
MPNDSQHSEPSSEPSSLLWEQRVAGSSPAAPIEPSGDSGQFPDRRVQARSERTQSPPRTGAHPYSTPLNPRGALFARFPIKGRVGRVPPALAADAELLYEHALEPRPCVYFLVRGDEVLYVGKSICLENRLLSHSRTIPYDRVLYFRVAEADMAHCERECIEELRPPYNFMFTKRPRARTRATCIECGSPFGDLRSRICDPCGGVR